MSLALYLCALACLVAAGFLVAIPLGVAVLGGAFGVAGWLLEDVDA